MRIVALIAAFLLALSSAQALDIERIEIVQYGLYAVDKALCQRDEQGIERCQRRNPRHLQATTAIPGKLGVEFGVRYRIIGAPKNADVTIRRVWRLPSPGFRTPKVNAPILQLERIDDVAIGETQLATYGFDDPWELVPGTWVLEFWHGERKLDEKSFTVTKP